MSGPEIPPLPVFTADAFLADLSAAVLGKARQAVRLGLVRLGREEAGSPWKVRSLRHKIDTEYRVSADLDLETGELSWINCTCAHGEKAGGGYSHCYHAGAVLLLLTGREKRS